MKNGILLLRVTIGASFVTHGAGKLFGAGPGGNGLSATAKHFESLGLKPGIVQAVMAGSTELGGGAGLLLGYRTTLAASAVVATMTTAIQRVHGKKGYDITQGGFEYNAVLIAAALTIAEQGPGVLSLDALRGKQRSGLVPGLFALGLGVGGALANGKLSGYFGGEPAAPEPEPATPEPVLAADPAPVVPAGPPASGLTEPVTDGLDGDLAS